MKNVPLGRVRQVLGVVLVISLVWWMGLSLDAPLTQFFYLLSLANLSFLGLCATYAWPSASSPRAGAPAPARRRWLVFAALMAVPVFVTLALTAIEVGSFFY